MSKKVFSMMVLTILALTMSVIAAVNVDLNGTWNLDAAKSTGLPPGMEQAMTIAQTGALNLETVVKGGPQGEQTVKDSYILDGRETRSQSTERKRKTHFKTVG